MAYVDRDFMSKKAFKEAVKSGEAVYVQRNAFGGSGCYAPGKAAIEGPHYPRPHTWYAEVKVDENDKVISVK